MHIIRKLLFLSIVLSCLGYEYVSAFNIAGHQADKNEILLPAVIEGYKTVGLSCSMPGKDELWEKFRAQNGNWTVLFDKATGSPHRAFGPAIRLSDFPKITEDNIRQAADAFVVQYRDLLGVDPGKLKFKRASQANGCFYVTYSQVYKGLDVIGSEVEVRIFANGNIPYFGADYFDDINVDIEPEISEEVARPCATLGIKNYDYRNKWITSHDGNMQIMPIKHKNTVEYKLVYRIGISSHTPELSYTSYVDANSGKILKRTNNLLNSKTTINLSGKVKRTSPADTLSLVHFPNMLFHVNGNKYLSDDNGNYELEIEQKEKLKADLTGKWVTILYQSTTPQRLTTEIKPGESDSIIWDDSNSYLSERIIYYATNVAHDFIKGIDSNFKAMDRSVRVDITDYGEPNAFSNIQTGDIIFKGAADTLTRIAECVSVLYHEYGHSIISGLYRELGAEEGLINFTAHEAFADLNSAAILGNPLIFDGLMADGSEVEFARNLDNNHTYPKDIEYESHYDSQILSGAYWDLRQRVNDNEWWNRLIHYVKYSLVDDEDLGIMFAEWFLETLIADDDDGDITNGTPHYEDIIFAFDKHMIGTNLPLEYTIVHSALPDTKITDKDYAVSFWIKGYESFGHLPLEPMLHYYINNDTTVHSVPAALIGGKYIADIPAQPNGTMICYYITAKKNISQDVFRFPSGSDNCCFLVDYETIFSDDFEQDRGWTIGAEEDDCSTAMWELAIPETVIWLTSIGEWELQSAGDHSPDGRRCLVTGGRSWGCDEKSALRSMPNGRTTVTSPLFDLSKAEKPIIRFHRIFFNSYWDSYDKCLIGRQIFYMSSDGGNNWTKVSSSYEQRLDWGQLYFYIEDYVDLTDKFLFRIECYVYMEDDNTGYTLTNMLVDDFELLKVATIDVREREIDEVTELSIIPNPASGSVNIICPHSYSGSYASEIIICDLMGRQLKRLKSLPGNEQGQYMINIEDLPAGIYIVHVLSGAKTLAGRLVRM